MLHDRRSSRPTKLHPKYFGPYVVVSHIRNDVTVRHLVMDSLSTFHVTALHPFYGSMDAARAAAQLDYDQHQLDRILAYRGDVWSRRSVQFLTRFADGTEIWKSYDADLSDTQAFEEFCRAKPQLWPLLLNVTLAKKALSKLLKQPMQDDLLGRTAYINLRVLGEAWYQLLALPHHDFTTYVLKGTYATAFLTYRKQKIHFSVPVLGPDAVLTLNANEVKSYGRVFDFDPSNMTLVTPALIKAHPGILQDSL